MTDFTYRAKTMTEIIRIHVSSDNISKGVIIFNSVLLKISKSLNIMQLISAKAAVYVIMIKISYISGFSGIKISAGHAIATTIFE